MEFFAALGYLVFFFGLIWLFSNGALKDFGNSNPTISIVIVIVLLALISNFVGYR